MTTEWSLPDWHKPDLDRGYIIHRTKTRAEVEQISERVVHKVCRAAERYAKAEERAGAIVTASEWVLGGKEYFDETE